MENTAKSGGPRELSPDVRKRLAWSNRELVAACLGGDEAAWAALLGKYQNLVYSIPLRHGLSREDAADIFQGVWMELVVELPRLREPEALAAWLISVTQHKCNRFKPDLGANADDALAGIEHPSETPDRSLRRLEIEQHLRDAIITMSPRCQRLLHALFYEDPPRPYDELAASLRLSVGSIGFIRGRCLKKLRATLEGAGF